MYCIGLYDNNTTYKMLRFHHIHMHERVVVILLFLFSNDTARVTCILHATAMTEVWKRDVTIPPIISMHAPQR